MNVETLIGSKKVTSIESTGRFVGFGLTGAMPFTIGGVVSMTQVAIESAAMSIWSVSTIPDPAAVSRSR